MKRLNDLYEQITPVTAPDELAKKVMNTEIRMTARKRPSKTVAALLAATVSISALTLTAGAANGWDYAGMFRNFFGEEKAENIMENIVPEATVLQDTIDTMDFELVAAAADNHGVLAILDIYSENGYKLIGKDENGNDIIYPFQDLFININSDSIYGSGISVRPIEKSEEKVRLGLRMNTDHAIKGEKLTISAWLQNKKDENGEYEFDVNADYSWRAEFVADYSAEEICYEKEMDLSGTDYEGKTVYSKIKEIQVSPISVCFNGENFDKYFDTLWCAGDPYVLLDNGEKVNITNIFSSGYAEGDPTGSTMLCMAFEEPVNPEEVSAVVLSGVEVKIK